MTYSILKIAAVQHYKFERQTRDPEIDLDFVMVLFNDQEDLCLFTRKTLVYKEDTFLS